MMFSPTVLAAPGGEAGRPELVVKFLLDQVDLAQVRLEGIGLQPRDRCLAGRAEVHVSPSTPIPATSKTEFEDENNASTLLPRD